MTGHYKIFDTEFVPPLSSHTPLTLWRRQPITCTGSRPVSWPSAPRGSQDPLEGATSSRLVASGPA